ncbi:HD domain-containing phosphohydrolase [Anaerosporobacter sp.]|uniref:HD domain-containing phosphohydrolase n=1 Tax=Anaerosporobacter sp. TaxID=1872529 RepID=UPI00286F7B56|nr:HD domain-containing phosphohydrolase [Anaerosporobacter sp.]
MKPLILVVDDIKMNTALLADMIEDMGYLADCANSVDEAIVKMEKRLPSVIISDIIMPEKNGYQFCEMIKKNPYTRHIPVIFISAADNIEYKQKAFEVGAADFVSKPYEFTEISIRINNQLRIYNMQKELECNNRRLNTVISEQSEKIEQERKNILKALAILVENHKSISNDNNLENISYNSRLLAQGLNFSQKYENKISGTFIESIGISATIHDIGMITIPKEILIKPTSLSEKEKEMVKSHTIAGAEVIQQIYPSYEDNEFVQMSIDIIKNHHEWWDGSGYPNQLKGEDIPLSARIVSIVNIYDKLVTERPYRPAITQKEAIQYINDNAGKIYDPYIVDVFNKLVKRMKVS